MCRMQRSTRIPIRTSRLSNAFYRDHRRQTSTHILGLVPHFGYTIALTVPNRSLRLAANYMYNGQIGIGKRRRKYWFTISMSFVIVAALVGTSIGGALVVQEQADKKAAALAAEQAAQSSSMMLGATPTFKSTSASASDAISNSPTSNPSGASGNTATDYTARPFGAIQSINTTCPSTLLISSQLEGKTSDISGAYRYSCLDSTNILDSTLMSFTAYTLEQCVDACSQYSAMDNSSNNTCKAAVISSDFGRKYETANGANCWLKSGAGNASTGQNGYTAAVLREA
ncbi:hypothetical protein ACET3X_001181 [Alternaria dauci]|uniref:Apple domain-containing protein n=1 Tax=Alternaria dauci TaxID=48095 RepID=A0ABR3UYV1_9PLEO